MQVKLMLPIATLHGKLSGNANYYFRTINGRTFVQHCPRRVKAPTAKQQSTRSVFAKRARFVARMRNEGTSLSVKQLWSIAIEAI